MNQNDVKSIRDMIHALNIKTYGYMLDHVDKYARDLYSGNMTRDQFVNSMADLIEQQLRRAWNEGMRNNELDPQTDMTDEWEQVYQELVTDQFNYIEGYADAIIQGAKNESGVDQFRARASLWANRYNETVDISQRVTADKGDKSQWVLGETEQHCDTCYRLNGIVAYTSEWEELGVHPQGAPNELLECGGWRCDCSLVPTDKRRSPKAFETIMDIVSK